MIDSECRRSRPVASPSPDLGGGVAKASLVCPLPAVPSGGGRRMSSRSRWAVAGLPLALVLGCADLFFGLRRLLISPASSDFTLYYGAALIGLHQGWSQIYDVAAEQRTQAALG